MKQFKNNALVLLIFSVTLLGLLGLVLNHSVRLSNQADLDQKTIDSYESEMIPLYKKKGQFAQRLLEGFNKQDLNVSGILSHVENWHATSQEDIANIEELNLHLDTWLSPYIGKLDALAKQEQSFKVLLLDIRGIDQRMASVRSRILPTMPSPNMAQN